MVEPEKELELVGEGPFLLPLCGPGVNVAVGLSPTCERGPLGNITLLFEG